MIACLRGRYRIRYRYKGKEGFCRCSTLQSALNTLRKDPAVQNPDLEIIGIEQRRESRGRYYWTAVQGGEQR